MHPRDPLERLPLRQVVTATGDAAAVFARQGLLDQLSRPERFRLAGHRGGGQILAASGRALAEAQAILRQAYGACIAFGVPTVHTYVDTGGGSLMVPVIFVRIDAPRAARERLQGLLNERAARVQDFEMRRDRIVVRAELELSRALDLEQRVAETSGRAAQVLSWLVRYEHAAAPGAHGKESAR